jgi:putative tryptophan/tyrosine transport system substrate-binding protein
MRRRSFFSVIGGAAAWPLVARAQQSDRMRLIGVLMGLAESDPEAQSSLAAFWEQLRKLGWKEGRNIEINIRWATSDVEKMKRYAQELVALQPDLIFTSTTPATAAMLQQTRTIPIVFVFVGDPVGSGFVANLSRPGGNVTGFTPIVSSLGGKWVELLKEIAPGIARVSLLFNPPTATFVESYLSSFKAAAARAAWWRWSHPFMICARSNSSLPHRCASQIVAWSCYQMPSQSAIARRSLRWPLASVSPPFIGPAYMLNSAV